MTNSNIQSLLRACQSCLDRAQRGRYVTDQYARISRADLQLGRTRFYVFAVVAYLANFHTKICDFARQRRYLRNVRSKSALNRQIAQLARGPSRVHAIGRHRYRVANDRRARPICMGLLYLCTDPEWATAVRLILLIAFHRGALRSITVMDIQRGLRIDRNAACAMHRWLISKADTIDVGRLRRNVFYSRRPAWWLYVRRPGLAPRGQVIRRSDFAPGPALPGTRVLSDRSNRYRPGGRPVAESSSGPISTGAKSDRAPRSRPDRSRHGDYSLRGMQRIGGIVSAALACRPGTPPSMVPDCGSPPRGGLPEEARPLTDRELQDMTPGDVLRYWRARWERNRNP